MSRRPSKKARKRERREAKRSGITVEELRRRRAPKGERERGRM